MKKALILLAAFLMVYAPIAALAILGGQYDDWTGASAAGLGCLLAGLLMLVEMTANAEG